MKIKIALAGNPNSGKTTLFNRLTGSNQYVGNWPGVTVEKKEGRVKENKNIIIQDLPGIYSLSPYSPEEMIARKYLLEEKPDIIINIVDATNIERNLYLTTQLTELGIPVVIALNMIDVVRKNKDEMDIKKLSKAFDCEVVQISALKGEGTQELVDKAVAAAMATKRSEPLHVFTDRVENAIAHIEGSIFDKIDEGALRWYAIKIFERDKQILKELNFDQALLTHLEKHISDCEKEMDDDAQSIITSQRYAYLSEVLSDAAKKKTPRFSLSVSDKIDRIVTHRILALPIFAAVMFVVYYISIGSVGAWITEWTNETFFGKIIAGNLRIWMETVGVQAWLISLVIEGIIGGVGAVLGFVPQMLILFLMLSILEDIGYLARVAFIMDRIFRKFGLSGKSFIPMLISSGCSVPGIMACRTIENEKDRKMTVMTTSFVPCGAKMPIIALFAGALFGDSGLVAVSAYFIGVAAVLISGVILKKTRIFSGKPAPFVLELPPYHVPTSRNVLCATWERGWSFIKRAGTIILISAVVLWFLQSFGIESGTLKMVEDNNMSLLAYIGNTIAFLFKPLGFGDWKSAVAIFTGLIAKENVVGTFGVLYGIAEVGENGMEIWSAVAANYTALTAYSFMLFNLLCAPCFAAIGAIRREMNSAKWTWFAVGYVTTFAYAVSLIVYQFGMLVSGAPWSVASVLAIFVFIGMLWLLFRKDKYASENLTVAVSLK